MGSEGLRRLGVRIALFVASATMALGSLVLASPASATPNLRNGEAQMGVDDCLKAKPPNITYVSHTSIHLEFQDYDACTIKTSSGIEYRVHGNGKWVEQDVKTTSGAKRWETWSVAINGLQDNTAYDVRTVINHFFRTKGTSWRIFRTGALQVSNVHYEGSSSGDGGNVELRATMPDIGQNEADIVRADGQGPGSGSPMAGTCDRSSDGSTEQCQWSFRFTRIPTPIPANLPPQPKGVVYVQAGGHYTFAFRLTNTAYGSSGHVTTPSSFTTNEASRFSGS